MTIKELLARKVVDGRHGFSTRGNVRGMQSPRFQVVHGLIHEVRRVERRIERVRLGR